MADLRREDGVLVEAWHDGKTEVRVHEWDGGYPFGVRLWVIEWIDCGKSGWANRHSPPSIGTRAELAAAKSQYDELSDRVCTVADENTGPHPVQTAAEALTCIERGFFKQRVDNEQLRAEVARLRAAGSAGGYGQSEAVVMCMLCGAGARAFSCAPADEVAPCVLCGFETKGRMRRPPEAAAPDETKGGE